MMNNIATRSIQPNVKVHKPSNYWTNIHNQRQVLIEIGKKLEINTTEDWYNVTCSQMRSNGGGNLLRVYRSSMIKMLQSLHPEIKWLPWKFSSVSSNYWRKEENVKQFMNWVSIQLNIRHMEDWYRISTKEFSKYGKGLIQNYHSSMFQLLSAVYPSYEWQPWKFYRKAPNRYWHHPENVLKYIKWLETQLGITKLSDWITVSAVDIARIYGGARVLAIYGGLQQLLTHFYPEFNWKSAEMQFQKGNSKAQIHLTRVIQKIFPNETVIENYRHPQLQSLELDVFLPHCNLALEYQGEQHYVNHYIFGDHQELNQRDAKKAALCLQHNIKLLQVPFWWDRLESSLRATIQKAFPELRVAQEGSEALTIPNKPPQRVLNIKRLSKMRENVVT